MGFLVRQLSTVPSKKCSCWRILFFGTDNFSLASLKALNQNRKDGKSLVGDLAVVTKDPKGYQNPVRQYAKLHDLRSCTWPIIDFHSVNGKHFDLGVVVSFGHLIPLEVIQQFPLNRGMLNIHGSLLPRWRGAAPVVHTILNGDTVSGVTIMNIAPHEFDVGKIVLQQSCVVPPRATTPQLTSILGEMGANLLIECLKNLRNNLRNSREQDSGLATRASKIRQSMAQLHFEKQTCLEIDRLHRAISDTIELETSWHGATVRLNDIVEPEVMESVDCLKFLNKKIPVAGLKPGSVIYHKRRKMLCILCKDGWVGFRSVHIERKATMTAADFYNGFISKVAPKRMHFTSTQKPCGIK